MSLFGYQNILESATLTPTSEAAGFPAENAIDYRLDDWWKPTASAAELVFDVGSAQSADYIGVAGHTIGSLSNGGITVSYSSDNFVADDNNVANYDSTVTTDAVVMRTFTSASARYWKIRFSYAGSAPSIGHVSIGARYSPPVGMQAGHVMPKYGMKHKYVNSLSDNGLFVGRSLIRSEYETTIDLNLISAAQMRSDIDPLIAHVIAKPFFFLWDETNYPGEAAYCWLRDDPSVSTNSSVHYSVSLPISAVV